MNNASIRMTAPAWLVASTAALAFLLAAPGAAPGKPATFAPPIISPCDACPSATLVGDLNGDGYVDMAGPYATATAGMIWVMLNNHDGTFSPAMNFPTGSSGFLAGGDIDGDGDIDIVNLNQFDGTLTVHFNNGDANFTLGATYPAGFQPTIIRIADLDHDGDLDVVVAFGGTMIIRFNDGDGAFPTFLVIPTGSGTNFFDLGDVNADGHLDIVSTVIGGGQFGGAIRIYTGDGRGGFTLWRELQLDPGEFASGAQIADLDHSGGVDLVTTGPHGVNGMPSYIGAIRQSSHGVFSQPKCFETGGATLNAKALADFNLDGEMDVITLDALTRALHIVWGDPLGTFVGWANLSQQYDAGAPMISDLDVFLLFHEWGGTSGEADLNGDLTVNGADLGTLLNNWGPVEGPTPTVIELDDQLNLGVFNIGVADLDNDGDADIVLRASRPDFVNETTTPIVLVLLNQTSEQSNSILTTTKE